MESLHRDCLPSTIGNVYGLVGQLTQRTLRQRQLRQAVNNPAQARTLYPREQNWRGRQLLWIKLTNLPCLHPSRWTQCHRLFSITSNQATHTALAYHIFLVWFYSTVLPHVISILSHSISFPAARMGIRTVFSSQYVECDLVQQHTVKQLPFTMRGEGHWGLLRQTDWLRDRPVFRHCWGNQGVLEQWAVRVSHQVTLLRCCSKVIQGQRHGTNLTWEPTSHAYQLHCHLSVLSASNFQHDANVVRHTRVITKSGK